MLKTAVFMRWSPNPAPKADLTFRATAVPCDDSCDWRTSITTSVWVLQAFSKVRQLGTKLRWHHGSHGSFWAVRIQQPMWPEHNNLEQGTPQLSLAIRRIVLPPAQAKSSYWGWIKAPRPHKAECWSSLSSFLLLKFAQENAGGFNSVPLVGLTLCHEALHQILFICTLLTWCQLKFTILKLWYSV